MKSIPVYNVTEITMEEWGAFAPQQKERHNDHIYPSPVRQGANMQILVNYNHSDASFQIEATGSDVQKMVETIYAEWERDDPGCDKPEFEVCKLGEKPLYFDTDGPCYVIFEF